MRPALIRTLPVALPLASLLSLAAGTTGCGPASPGPRITPAAGPDVGSAASREGTIMFDCTPADALIVVDGSHRHYHEGKQRETTPNLPTKKGFRNLRGNFADKDRHQIVRASGQEVSAVHFRKPPPP